MSLNSGQPIISSGLVYCQTWDVERIIGLASGFFTTTSNPSLQFLQETIQDAQDYIDKYTQHSWRERFAEDGQWEPHTLGRIGVRGSWFVWLGYPVYLKHRRVLKLNAAKGDKMEVFNGNTWEDWLAIKTEAETVVGDGDYWVDYDQGVIYFRGLWVYLGLKEYVFRIKYRYGDVEMIPRDIRKACAYLVAAEFAANNDKTNLLPTVGDGVLSVESRVKRWEEGAKEILERYVEFTLGGY